MKDKMSLFADNNSDPEPIRAAKPSSWAYDSMRKRLPGIICRSIDVLSRSKKDMDEIQREDSKGITARLNPLRYEVERDKPFNPITDGKDDHEIWNSIIEEEAKRTGKQPSWFTSSWLLAECFAYRKMREAFNLSSNFEKWDFFKSQKEEQLNKNAKACIDLVNKVGQFKKSSSNDNLDIYKSDFMYYLQCSLWGNKCDMSISGGSAVEMSWSTDDVVSVAQTDMVIVNHADKVWNRLTDNSSSQTGKTVDIILDNAGFELVADLCLAMFLLESGLVEKVRLHCKLHPWFVSDTTRNDIDLTLAYLSGRCPWKHDGSDDPNNSDKSPEFLVVSDGPALAIGQLFVAKFEEQRRKENITVHDHPFWTYPHPYSEMSTVAPDLHKTLSESSLLIFKGDLNHRKLLGDLQWPPETDFKRSLRGFQPAPLVTLRTLKSELVSGLPEGKAEELSKIDEHWMTNGKWALIQYSE